MKRLSLLFVLLFSVGVVNLLGQGILKRLGKRIVDRAEEQVEQRVEQRAEEGVEKAMDKVENGVRNPEEEQVQPEFISNEKPVTLQSSSQYDFVPGDLVLLFEDFSQDAVGDFPALWTTNGSGEVKTLNLAPGNWLHLTTTDNQYQLMKHLELPDNYIVEFDVILPSVSLNHPGLYLTFFKSDKEDVGYLETNPQHLGFSLFAEASDYNSWMGKAFHDGNWMEGSSALAPLKENVVEHIILWIQKRRLRVYHSGQKVLDLPTLIPAGFKPNRLTFDLSGCNDAVPYLSNIRITTAAPDTRNKLLKEGKLISYGIYFDTNSDQVKPESTGTLMDIAKTIQEANGVKVQIVGHTDSTGDEAKNLDLSKRRAASVKAELVKLGVKAEHLTTDGAGELKPIAPNDTPSNKALNRRVEFIKQ